MVKLDKREWKAKYFVKLTRFLNEFGKVVIIGVDNVQSRQMQDVRIAFRGKAELLMGKNTMIRKCLREMSEAGKPELKELLPFIVGNMGFLFTDMDLMEASKILSEFKVQSAAKIGVIAPVDVIVPAGPTGMGPEKTSFFQALNLPTKIVKGNIEILNAVTVVKKGNKVGISESKLLNMLNISPFWYQCEVLMIMDNGAVYPPAVLNMSLDTIRGKIMEAATYHVAPLSLGLGIPNAASAPHMIMNAFKNALAIAAATDITFKEAEKVKLYLKDPAAFAAANASSAPAAAPAAGGAPAAAKAKEPEPEEEDDAPMEMGLFD